MKRTKKRPVGRPKIPDKKMPFSVRLPPSVVMYLRTWDKPADIVQAMVESSVGYQQWKGAKECQSD